MSSGEKTTPSKSAIAKDAQGQFAKSGAGRTNNGVASAKPRVLTGKDDATAVNKEAVEDWDINFDINEQTNKRD